MSSSDPGLAQVHQLYSQGQFAEAEQQCRQLIQTHHDPAVLAECWHWVGMSVQRRQQFSDAVQAYQQAIALKPLAKSFNNLGTALKAQSQYSDAIAAYQQALDLKPHYPEVHNNLGNLFKHHEQPEMAIAHYQKALEQSPTYVEAIYGLGTIYHQQERYTDAIAQYQQALEINPTHADALNSLGNALQKTRQFEEAVVYYERALQQRPNDPAFYNNLGAAFQELKQLDASIANYRQALTLNPNYADAHYNLGNNYKNQGQWSIAVECYRRAIAIRPDYAAAYNNLGLTLHDQGNLPDAVSIYQQALKHRVPYPDAHLNMSLSLLLSGDLVAGFQHYEWRWQVKGPNFKPPRSFRQPQWTGDSLPNQTILLHAEQGFGDTIQFIRYLPLVKERVGRIVVECQAPLVKLLRSLPEIDEVVGRNEPIPDFQVHAPLMSLPYICQTDLSTVPPPAQFSGFNSPQPLDDVENLTPEAKTALLNPDQTRIGLVWSGSAGNQSDRYRSCQLQDFSSLFEIPNVQFFSLQKDVRSQDEEELQNRVHSGQLYDLRDALNDFTDTAAIVLHLDLVICVDTSVGHLAGTLGKPVWILLATNPDWRWMQYRDGSPWYPTVRLFRQTQPGQWQEVVERIGLTLRSRLPHHQHDIDAEAAQRCLTAGNAARSAREYPADLPQAIQHYQDSLQFNPFDPRTYNNLGVTLRQQKQPNQAIACYHNALALKPEFADGHYNLANALRDRGDIYAAAYHYRRALAERADNPNAWINLGNTLKEFNALEPAVTTYQRAIALDNNHASAYYNLGYVQLLQGNLEPGFANYEHRWRVKSFKPPRPYAQPLWTGEALQGRTILLYDEQGFGDAIQFSRYIAQVVAQGGRVVLECREPLVPILSTIPGVEQCIPRDHVLPEFQVHAPLMSLPYILGTAIASIPANIPYLTAPKSAALPNLNDQALNIGIVWGGSPTHLNDRQRSCPLALFQEFLTMPNVQLYSLQKGDRVQELQGTEAIIDLSNPLNDFADTAGAIAQLDLVITVDTAVAHLAGALGKEVWILLPFAPDWRWLLDREDSPWYPTARLFRQPQRGDWISVFAAVKRAIFHRRSSSQATPKAQSTAIPKNTTSDLNFSTLSPKQKPIAIGWQLSPATGWGIYGTNLAIQLLKTQRFAPVPLLPPMLPEKASFNPLHWALLRPIFDYQARVANHLKQVSDRQIRGNFLVLRGLGNQFITAPDLKRISGKATVGVIFFEDTRFTPQAITEAQQYDLIVAGSSWNAEVLKQQGLERVVFVPQGIDPTIFHPAPCADLFGDRFVIFSGGKLEYRKGQDQVVKAFRIFHQRHPDALLLTAWHNFWPKTMTGLDAAGHVTSLPKLKRDRQLAITDWLIANGIPEVGILDVGLIPNHLVGQILREVDVAVFPNRCEGGTNLAAMESLACGIPTVLSANTGHLDLIDENHCYPLRSQSAVKPLHNQHGVEGWGESSIDEIVETLESIYGDRTEAQRRGQASATFMQDWTWSKQIQRLLQTLDPFIEA